MGMDVNPREPFRYMLKPEFIRQLDSSGAIQLTLAERAALWLLSRGQTPHPMLPVAVPVVMAALIDTRESAPAQAFSVFSASIKSSLHELSPDLRPGVKTAALQFMEFMVAVKPTQIMRGFDKLTGQTNFSFREAFPP